MHILITNDDGYLAAGIQILAESMIPHYDPYGTPIYRVGPPGAVQDAGPGTDFYSVEHNQVSVIPLQIDLTRHDSIDPLNNGSRPSINKNELK
jgi:5'-nucleotidase